MIINSIDKTFSVENGSVEVLRKFSLTIAPQSIVALVGPSGCGKTTLLRVLGDLENYDGGTITKEPSEEGNVSYLFQEPRLLPWLSIVKNITIVLRPFIEKEKERVDKALEFLSLVELEEYKDLTPLELSGGMRQRVAIARSFAYPAQLMLLDEPFQSLDASLRWSLVSSFAKLYEKHRRTTVFVTHDIAEALMLADVVIKLSKRPMQIEHSFSIDIEREHRSLKDPQLLSHLTDFYTYP
jgi:NitT/TauT family transport system ATP-binding protein